MSCYLRHLNDLFTQAGIQVTPANRKQLDQAIHRIAEVTYKDCPETWKRLKQDWLSDERKRRNLVKQLRDAIS